ncbi:MAG: hypothetical protein M1829_005296 [Trizodia sp. TS-e1964]|nr:MAG: hypothetical protein M1829_005296 [Trizodia sp. TS-e1964]
MPHVLASRMAHITLAIQKAPSIPIPAAIPSIAKRLQLPYDSNSPQGLIDANTADPWQDSAKYALAWVYFSIGLLIITTSLRLYHLWTDKLRTALFRDDAEASKTSSPDVNYEMNTLPQNDTTPDGLFSRQKSTAPGTRKYESSVSSIRPFNQSLALVRWLTYRSIPALRWRKQYFHFPAVGSFVLIISSLTLVTLYAFIPNPLYWSSMAFGSPPIAIRSGMLAVSMIPWIIALSMKANLISIMTGIGHERLNVLHRWAGYICLFLSLVHTVPFYLQQVWDRDGAAVFQAYFDNTGTVIYGSGIACLVPLTWLCVASLPFFRSKMYELFVLLHGPISVLFLGLLFWHCNRYLTSWNHLFATLAIWISSYLLRFIFYLNWTNPRRFSWLIGDEAALTLLPENAVKITIPTQMRWRAGQYVYLRMPGISIFENHPFTIASLCSDDFPSTYGPEYKDMILVFRTFSGFTARARETALAKGPSHTYRAFLDGPYGGMHRRLDAFDTVVLIAGGSGITAIISHLLELVKRMRDSKAVTQNVHVYWAIKRPEAIDWYREELRICREFAPPGAVHCQFFITAAKRVVPGSETTAGGARPISGMFHDRINDYAQGVASKRTSAYIREEADGDAEREKELRSENEDALGHLPFDSLDTKPPPNLPAPPASADSQDQIMPAPPNQWPLRPPAAHTRTHTRLKPSLAVSIPTGGSSGFDFGFPSTPTVFQKSLMRFAFGVGASRGPRGWATTYGRPELAYMLKELAPSFGRRTCVFVCGPPGMREDVARTVAGLQTEVLRGRKGGEGGREEVFLHTENFAI